MTTEFKFANPDVIDLVNEINGLENRNALLTDVAEYCAGVELASNDIEITELSHDTFLINHASRDFTRELSAGWEIDSYGEITLAKRRSPKRRNNSAGKNSQKAAMSALKKGATFQLEFFNDEFALRTTRKIFKEYIESDNIRNMPAFMKAVDDLIATHRVLVGHEDVFVDTDEDGKADFDDEVEEASVEPVEESKKDDTPPEDESSDESETQENPVEKQTTDG